MHRLRTAYFTFISIMRMRSLRLEFLVLELDQSNGVGKMLRAGAKRAFELSLTSMITI